ncbi:Polysaccharide biosynthesis protein [Caballeronia temeraria]|uniref:Polysaccharide biosynthesis protein n=1 Tax=Caballeronia temeraria TaxID=1777137 RepID=A0A158CVB3_9BURK|nr:oligosaccharide flippase family protein [Caballeronia temeraria]SAK86323.1 Polysaccharide biosynthesis protein [Caballeronia temeraria]
MNFPRSITQRLRSSGSALELVFKGANALFVKLAGTAFSFAFIVLLSRGAGKSAAGNYFLALNITTVLATIARFGLDNAVTRSAALALRQEDRQTLKGILLSSLIFTLTISIVFALLLACFSDPVGRVFNNADLSPVLRLMAVSIVPVALYTICFQFLQGVGSTQSAVKLSTIWPQLASLIILAPTLYIMPANAGGIAYALGAFVALGIAYIYVSRHPLLQWKAVRPNFNQGSVFSMGKVLFVASLCELSMTWAPSILVGFMRSSGDVALFSVAQRITMLIGFFFISINMIAMPKIAALCADFDWRGVAHTVKRSSILMTAGALPLFILCVVCPRFLLRVFGDGFVDASSALIILAIGQMASVVTGPVASTLVMCGRERTYRNIQIIAGLFCLSSLTILTRAYGPNGAALAVAATNWLQKLLCAYFVWSRFSTDSRTVPSRTR